MVNLISLKYNFFVDLQFQFLQKYTVYCFLFVWLYHFSYKFLKQICTLFQLWKKKHLRDLVPTFVFKFRKEKNILRTKIYFFCKNMRTLPLIFCYSYKKKIENTCSIVCDRSVNCFDNSINYKQPVLQN